MNISINASEWVLNDLGPKTLTFSELITEYCTMYYGSFSTIACLFFMAFCMRFYILSYAEDGFADMWSKSFLSNEYYKGLLKFIDVIKTAMETILFFCLGYFLYIAWYLGFNGFMAGGVAVMGMFTLFLFVAQIIGRFKRWKDEQHNK